MQWTVIAAEPWWWRCEFMCFVFAFTMDASLPILDAKFCDQDTGTNLHTQDRSKVLNASVRHVLIGAICHVHLFGTNLHTQES